ncbi:MAG: futalosine hydrolase [Nitrospiraceae bacterium]|nr:futalosine hydrolase [Nitrospiraceae bacterium]
MNINALIIPTMIEAGLVLSEASGKKTSVVQGKTFVECMIRNTRWVIAICGPGKANAAHSTGLLIQMHKPDTIHMIGVAGAYVSSGLEIGDVALGTKEIYADEGLMLRNGIRTMDELNLPVASSGSSVYYNEFPLYIPEQLSLHQHKGAFATVSSCTGTDEAAKSILKKFNVICENMEGAAAAHICALSNAKMVELRGISNIIMERDSAPLDNNDLLKGAESVQKFFLDRLV